MTIVCGDSHLHARRAGGRRPSAWEPRKSKWCWPASASCKGKPRAMRITVDGTLPSGTEAKDIILHIIARITASGRNRPFHRIRRRGDPLALDGGTHDGMQHEYRVRRPRRHDRPRPDDLRLPARTRTRAAGRGVRRRRSAVAGNFTAMPTHVSTANTGSTPPRSRR